ncbi:MAG: response regulator [Myxococcales bacterium]|nr:response regulator [Myxococcales bacterium]
MAPSSGVTNQRTLLEAKLLDAVQQAVIATDTRGSVIFWNEYARSLFGWTSAEALGRSIIELTPHESSRDEAAAIMERLARGQSWAGEFPVRRKDGTTFIAFVVNSPILDESGALQGVVGVSTDVSERRVLESRLRQATKMEAVGRLAGGVAHDFNNILTVILGNTSTLLAASADPHERELLREVEDASLRAASLTRQLLTFSRREFVRPLIIDVSAALTAMTPMLRRLIAEDIAIELQIAPASLRTVLDAGQLDQLVLNLAVNARDAMVGGGRLSFVLDSVETPLPRSPTHAEGRWLRLCVSDTGTGIAPEAVAHVFEPFFTSKPAGLGTGLGLATVHGIVTQAGGSIDVDSSPAGTTFHIFLPRTSELEASRRTPLRPPADGGGRTILLTEDEPQLRVLLRRTLHSVGYHVLLADNGQHAMEVAKQHQGTIDLLLTDIVMPGINGVVLAEHIRTLHPTVAVLLMTGYSESHVLDRGARLEGVSILHKPFLPNELLAAVTAAMGPPAARR